MTKNNKVKEKPKVKILAFASKREMMLMYIAIKLPMPGQAVGRADWKEYEDLYNVLTEGADQNENDEYEFKDRENIVFIIRDHEKLLKKLDQKVYTDLEVAKAIDELMDRLENCETVSQTETSELEEV